MSEQLAPSERAAAWEREDPAELRRSADEREPPDPDPFRRAFPDPQHLIAYSAQAKRGIQPIPEKGK